MINRVGFNEKEKAVLIILVDTQHRDILQYCINNDVHLSRYYFMQMFEFPQCHDYHTNMHFYITDLTIGKDGLENPLVKGGLLYPIRADFSVGIKVIDGLRAPWARHPKGPLPDYQRIDLAKLPTQVEGASKQAKSEPKNEPKKEEISFDEEEEDIFS